MLFINTPTKQSMKVKYDENKYLSHDLNNNKY